MTHIDEERLLAYASGRLPEAELEEIQTHLGECPSCADIVYSHLDDVMALARELGPVPVPLEWEDQIMRQLPRLEQKEVSWPEHLPKRSRTLLTLGPILALREWDTKRDEDTRQYDTIALALKAFDLIVESTGFGVQVSEEDVFKELQPLLHQMDLAANVPSHRGRQAAFVSRLLGRLRRDEDARRPFIATYADFENNRLAKRDVPFHLLEERFVEGGQFALRLSTEATNMYLGALDLAIEDAQAALEGVIKSQIDRGRFDEAVHFAQDARARSVQLQEKFDRLLRDTRRDVTRVDWQSEVPRMLSEGLSHLSGRLRVEQEIVQTARDRLEQLPLGSEKAQQVARIATLIDECFIRHTNLHHVLLEAREVFFAEQDRQAFVPRARAHLPNLFSEVLEPLLAAPGTQALTALEGDAAREGLPDEALPIWSTLLPVEAPQVFSLTDLVSWLLRPKRAIPAESTEATALIWEEAVPDPQRYPPEIQAAGQAYLGRGATRLSDLLNTAAQEEQPQAVLEYLGLRALQAFEDDRPSPLKAEREGTLFETAGFYGDELTLNWLNVEQENTS
ncbi:zf-HC2 domain-containing protein [Deinococcus sp. HMF7604]|uniref:zf-HC2 domain-containing protein n=1 Tax=Deinococcus betulae TaxID=2873312 RepID=UPI001CCE7740|nr:zf-HC2 domain-containing protein [Deinococcus betulae]MBZ9752403.1 zf-HC2 domain-containing protein [Deinococcus betulae]